MHPLKHFLRFLIPFTVIILGGCSAPGLDAYADRSPQFVPETFFNGPLQAHGVVKNRSGEVIRTFTAQLQGSWKDGQGLLQEKFLFNDGEVQYRNWRLVPTTGAGKYPTYQTTAEDVIGPGELTVAGNAAFMRYTLEVPYGDSKIQVSVKDRMYLTTDQVLIGESELTKWGFRVGEIVLTIFKSPPPNF